MRDEMADEVWAGSLLDTTYRPRLGPETHRQYVALIIAYLKHAASKGIDNNTARYTLRKELIDNIAPFPVVLRRARRNYARPLDPLSGWQLPPQPSSGQSRRA